MQKKNLVKNLIGIIWMKGKNIEWFIRRFELRQNKML